MSLQNDIYHKLIKAIASGELGPGEKLSEIELAKKMNASRTPIREVFRQLQSEGYITVSPYKGAYVSKLPPEEIEEIYNIVSLLEGYAAELAAQRVHDSEITRLKMLQKKLVFSATQKTYRDYIEKNTEFHHLIMNISGNTHLVKVIADLRRRIYRYRLMSVTIPGYLEKYASDHEKIIRALEKKDGVLARKSMQEHVNFVEKVLVGFLKENFSF
jgi:DNA-binding GntR family transcriptional regulator